MAATRKLQGEIDRCFKKVSEGVEIFEDIWQKVYSATNSNQKEKYEADLKKEIKKLQRLRDQIKSWLQSPEIKDKSALTEHRKLIETQMERFKIVERETKTKAYSKEGLGAAQKMDPAQKEREEVVQWLNASIDSLNLQVDQFECEIESLLAAKKKKLDREKTERIEKLKEFLERHRFHIRKLEMLLRMLDNMSIEVEEIKILEDDVAYYIESCQDPDFKENPYIYDEINFEEFIADSGRPSSADGAFNESANHSDVNGSQNTSSPVNTPNHAAPATPNDSPDERRPKTRSVSGDSGSKSSTAAIIKSPPMYKTPTKSTENKPAATPTSKNTSPSSNTTSRPVLSASNQQFTIEEVNGSSTHSSGVEPTTPKEVSSTSSSSSVEANQPSKIGSVESSRSSTGASSISSASSPLPGPAALSPGLLNSDEPANIPSGYSQCPYELKEAYIPPLLGVTPLGPMHLSSEQQLQRQLLESAFRNLPHPSDSERLRYYLYRTPWITPQYYPQTPLPGSDSLEFFQKLSTESLFFIFYYLEGTKAQYLAAKALKKQSWRFHTRCMMWFQRHDEPKTITEEYEQGTYIYFDFEKWGQRKKEGFTFEYRYLEDRDLN